MIAAVADTHTVVWYLFGDERLSTKAREAIDEAARSAQQVAVSTITLAEVIYLIEKYRLAGEVLERLLLSLEGNEVFVEAPFDITVAKAMQSVSRTEVPDLPDRIIAATAVSLEVPLISRDGKIRHSSVETIW